MSGGLVYPRYRYFVRGLYLDRYAPWASNLFDFKENLATLGLPLAIGAFVLARELAQAPADPDASSLRCRRRRGSSMVCLLWERR